MKVIEAKLDTPLEYIFNLNILNNDELVGHLTVYKHPKDENGGQLHIEIVSKWRCRWLTRTLRDDIMQLLKETAKKYGLSIIYSTALTAVSPRLLVFAGFTEYYKRQPNTYYYLMI